MSGDEWWLLVVDTWMSFSHWLVDEKRGAWLSPIFSTGNNGIPVTGPSIFTKRELLINPKKAESAGSCFKDHNDSSMNRFMLKHLQMTPLATRSVGAGKLISPV